MYAGLYRFRAGDDAAGTDGEQSQLPRNLGGRMLAALRTP